MVRVDCNPDTPHAENGTGNAGVYCSDIRVVHRVEFPPSISDTNQEIGRSRRNDEVNPEECMHQVAIHADSFLNIHKIINDKQTKAGDPIYRNYHIDELIDAAKLFASSNACHLVTMEMGLGNANGVRTVPPPHAVYPNCEKFKIFPSTNKDSLMLFLFDIFISSLNMFTPERVCDFLHD